MVNIFYHTGAAGDIIYSLPTVKAMGGGIYVTGLRNKELHNSLKPLLQYQDYIENVHHISEHCLPPNFINLDFFRQQGDMYNQHLCLSHLQAQFQYQTYSHEWQYGWLKSMFTNKTGLDYAVVNRTARYNDKLFNWKKEIKWLKERVRIVFFLGTKEEYEAFDQPTIDYLETENHYGAARVIQKAKYFSGNQSSLLAIAQGLGRTYRMEVAPHHPNCTTNMTRETILNPITNKIHRVLINLKQINKVR